MKLNILDLLLPRETKFFDYFNQQADCLVEACGIFKNLMDKLEKSSEDEVKKKISEIKAVEQKGDLIERTIIEELHKTFITPFDREDIHMLAVNIDKSIDILNSISHKIQVYDITKVPADIINFAEIIVEIAEEHRKLIYDLKSKKNLDATIKNMHKLENNGDYLFRLSLGKLFKEEKDPVEIIKFKQFYEHLEAIVDSIDYTGKIVRRIMIKQG